MQVSGVRQQDGRAGEWRVRLTARLRQAQPRELVRRSPPGTVRWWSVWRLTGPGSSLPLRPGRPSARGRSSPTPRSLRLRPSAPPSRYDPARTCRRVPAPGRRCLGPPGGRVGGLRARHSLRPGWCVRSPPQRVLVPRRRSTRHCLPSALPSARRSSSFCGRLPRRARGSGRSSQTLGARCVCHFFDNFDYRPLAGSAIACPWDRWAVSALTCPLCAGEIDPVEPGVASHHPDFDPSQGGASNWVPFVEHLRGSPQRRVHPDCFARSERTNALIELVRACDEAVWQGEHDQWRRERGASAGCTPEAPEDFTALAATVSDDRNGGGPGN